VKDRSFDLLSFVFGLLFVGAAAAHFLDDRLAFSLDTRWIWPVLLIVAGVAVLAGAIRATSDRNGRDRDTPDPS
jgi:hypothetical protein